MEAEEAEGCILWVPRSFPSREILTESTQSYPARGIETRP